MGCQNPCYEGKQYPLAQNGSMLSKSSLIGNHSLIRTLAVGDLCADTRPSPMNAMCADPPGHDCSGQAWVNTPIHNYMGFTFSLDVSDAHDRSHVLSTHLQSPSHRASISSHRNKSVACAVTSIAICAVGQCQPNSRNKQVICLRLT